MIDPNKSTQAKLSLFTFLEQFSLGKLKFKNEKNSEEKATRSKEREKDWRRADEEEIVDIDTKILEKPKPGVPVDLHKLRYSPTFLTYTQSRQRDPST